MKKIISIVMIFCLSINSIFYIIEFYKSISYDSFIFVENNFVNYRIVLFNILLTIIIVLLLIISRIKLSVIVFLFSLIWINNWFILGVETLEAIFYGHYVYVFKLIFSVFSFICILVSLITLMLLMINFFKMKRLKH